MSILRIPAQQCRGHSLPTCNAAPPAKIQNGRKWGPKWPTGSGKVSTPRFWGAPVNFR